MAAETRRPFDQFMSRPIHDRPAHFLPLDRIHENGHPDIARFTTDEFKKFHEYLTKSTEDGRSFRGSGKIDLEDIVIIQEKILEELKTRSSEENQGAGLDTLLSLCELNDLRDKYFFDFLTEEGFGELYTDILYTVGIADRYVNDQIKNPGVYIGFNLLIDAAQRFTENNPELCRQMGKKAVPGILEIVNDPFFEVKALNRDDEFLKWMSRRELLKKMFTLLYNCIRNHPDNRVVFRRSRASELLKPFLDCHFYILRTKALFILSYIVTEEENIDLNTTSLNIEYIVKVLRRALEEPSHYSAHYNFFAVEVMEAVQRVAANDDNKDKFIKAGVLPYLVTMMEEKNSKEERNTALNALWVLSFTAYNKDAILNEKGCIDRAVADSDHDGDSHKPPAPSAVREVMDFVTETLDSLRQHWARMIEYDVCFLCPKCSMKKLLKDCYKGMSLNCGIHIIPTAAIRFKFGMSVEGVEPGNESPISMSVKGVEPGNESPITSKESIKSVPHLFHV
eukprot:XP_011673234.1 PREDICTED: uncharacterized protein LOC105442628 [Strongylocentrotus purpuratus]